MKRIVTALVRAKENGTFWGRDAGEEKGKPSSVRLFCLSSRRVKKRKRGKRVDLRASFRSLEGTEEKFSEIMVAMGGGTVTRKGGSGPHIMPKGTLSSVGGAYRLVTIIFEKVVIKGPAM